MVFLSGGGGGGGGGVLSTELYSMVRPNTIRLIVIQVAPGVLTFVELNRSHPESMY